MGEEKEEEEQGGGEEEMVKEAMLALSGSLHSNGGSWRLQELQGLVQQRGEKEEEPPRNSWIELDLRCSRQEEQMG